MKSLATSTNRCRFADTTFISMGQVKLSLTTPYGKNYIPVTQDVLPAEICTLLGMDVLDWECLAADTVASRLTERVEYSEETKPAVYYDQWYVSLYRSKANHIYAEMNCPADLLLTMCRLHKLHRKFCHPSPEKPFNLLRRSRPEEISPEILTILQDLTKRCDPCQQIQSTLTRFRLSFGAENVRFGKRILLDIVTIDKKPVLHTVGEGTRSSAARFVPGLSTKTILATTLECWAMIYTRIPNRVLVDQRS